MYENFILWIIGVLTIYIPTIALLKTPINKYVTVEKDKLFATIETYGQPITERLFENWVSKYEEIISIQAQFITFNRVSIGLVGFLFLTYIIENTSQEYMIVFNMINMILGAFFGVLFFSMITWWLKKENNQK